jgi:DNA polymerase III subunit beta
MKIAANAGELANALALAASLSSSNKGISNIVGLEALCLAAADDELTIAADVLDFAITLTVPAVVESPGEVAVSASRLSALAAGFLPEATIEIQSDGTVCRVGSDRSRFKLPTIALEDLPAMLKLTEETGNVALAREEAATLLVRPAFAVSTEKTRYYLGGILLHDHEEALTAVATDGRRLVRIRVPGATGLSSDFRLIVPNAALKIIAKLLGDKSVERVTLRRSKTLLSVEGVGFVFVSKLIDADFPSYTRIVPKPSSNTVTVDRIELLRALDRVAAVVDPGQRRVVVGLTWTEQQPALRLGLTNSDDADDVVTAEVTGCGRVAVQISLLTEMLHALGGQRVRIASDGGINPILLSDIDRSDFLGLQMPYQWPARATQAA